MTMKSDSRIFLAVILALASSSISIAQVRQPESGLTLRYEQPARAWEEALPLGNGKTGAMVFGGVSHERIQLNDNTLWSGYPEPGNNPDARNHLPRVRQAVIDGDYEAAAVAWKKMQGPYSARYLPMADLLIDSHLPDTAITQYTRRLDLRTAVSTVEFSIQNARFRREVFISNPGRLLVMRISADKRGIVGLTVGLSSKLKHEVVAVADNHLVLRGKAPMYVAHRDSDPRQVVYDDWDGEGTNFQVHVVLKPEGGTILRTDTTLTISRANAVTLHLVGATSFNGPNLSPGLQGRDPAAESRSIIAVNSKKSYEQLRALHINDYQARFDRVSLKLGTDRETSNMPTDKRIIRFNEGHPDPGLLELYYQFGRYLLLAASRHYDGKNINMNATPAQYAPPANLQGIWNDHIQPPWGSNYTTNINLEMNYWLADATNLSECLNPLFDLIRELEKHGTETAATNYGIQPGWCVHHNSDIWAKTSPAGGYDRDPRSQVRWSCWPMAGAWLTTHLWDHYTYTGDQEFLRSIWPTMKGAAQFLLAWLQPGPNGFLVTNPSTSPENVFKINGKELQVSMASTMDMAITRQLFAECLTAASMLGVEDEFTFKVTQALSQLYPYQIGQYGQLQEWFKDWDDPNDRHRHISHLFGLHPGNQITPTRTPELAAAAKKTLTMRGDAGTGWSMAWKVNWWARLHDGDRALKLLRDGLAYIDPTNKALTSGGTYPNLFDAHPPFQIDGNFGATAGITEMLLQSHDGEVFILPALPGEWKSGQVSGLRARGGFEVSIQWSDWKPAKVVVTSSLGGNLRLRSNFKLMPVGVKWKEAIGPNPNPLVQASPDPAFEIKPGVELDKPAARPGFVIDIETEKGKTYTLRP